MIERNISTIDKAEQSVNKFRLHIVFAFVGILFAVTAFISLVIIQNSVDTMRDKVASLVASNNYQQVMNVDNYIENIKDTSSLFFSDETYYKYDATSEDYEEFEKIQSENAILDRIQDLGVLQNYSDFGIVYANEHTVGWISTESYKLFGDGNIYEGFASKIADDSTDSGWFADFNNQHNTIYYVKRLNPNAVMFTSFYAREFEDVFRVPQDMKDMIVRLVDENNVILYSNDKDKIGKEVNENIAPLIDENGDFTALRNGYLLTVNGCNNGSWRLVCSVPENTIMKEIYASRIYTYTVTGITVLVVLLLGLFVLYRVSNPVGEMMSALAEKAEHDLLTGLLNKVSFTEVVATLIGSRTSRDTDVFVMLDMDNFKSVNDTLGHNKGDEVLVRFSNLFKRHFSSRVMTGRMGGDEFALFVRFTDMDYEAVLGEVNRSLDVFRSEFVKEFAEENKSCGLSLSAGILIDTEGTMDFETMYKSADDALYNSKNNGKNKFSFY